MFLLFFVTASPATAEKPIDVRGSITDNVDILGSDKPRVEDALKEFSSNTGFQLFVVYVASFEGMSGADWADETALKSGLGTTDILLAVATDEGRYGIAVPQEHSISDEEFTDVEVNDIRPALARQDFAEAAIAAAEGYTEASQNSGLPWGAIVIGGVVIAGAGAYAIHRTRRKYETTHVVLDEHGNPVDPLSLLSTEELTKKASSSLVALDDALKTSEQELGYAEAQFGREATREFSAVLDAGKEAAKKAFGIQQKLDDDVPDTEEEVRAMVIEIIHLCQGVDHDLDEQVEGFDALRDLQACAPEVLEETAQRASEVENRLPSSKTVLEQLGSRYPTTDLASVAGNVDQAASLLTAAKQQVDKGKAALTTNDRATAVAAARAAEDGVAQAVTLLDAIDNADSNLQSASARITAGLTSLNLDIADAERLAQNDAGIAAAAAKARDAITYVQAGEHDPLAAVRRLETTEAALDELLAPVRAAAAEAEKASTALMESLGRVTSEVKAVSDFIETRRGAVRAEARTRLSEAARLLDQAQAQMQSSPQKSLAALQRADLMAKEAERLAQHDVDEWDRGQKPDSRGGTNSMILGGILIDSILRGGGGGGGLGGILNGGSENVGGNRGHSTRGPGSFGGSSTRSRRGGGGRF
ncbi:MAG: TPM domain-containing protein [Actinomycetota bacterium]|nr:TPM domain-containing protein [Actinomycetota bacterium]